MDTSKNHSFNKIYAESEALFKSKLGVDLSKDFIASIEDLFSAELYAGHCDSSENIPDGFFHVNASNGETVGNKLYRTVFDKNRNKHALGFTNEYGGTYSAEELMCPDKLVDTLVEYFPNSCFFDNHETITSENGVIIDEPVTLEMSNLVREADKKDTENFAINMLALFSDSRKEIGALLIETIFNSYYFSEVMIDFSEFVAFNEIVAKYLETGNNVELKDFSMQNNPDFVLETFDKFNNLTFTMHEHTNNLAKVVFSVNTEHRVFNSLYTDKKITPNISLYELQLENFTAFDLINISRGRGNDFKGFFPNNDEKLEKISQKLEDLEINKHDTDFFNYSPEFGALNGCSLLELRNTLMDYRDTINTDKYCSMISVFKMDIENSDSYSKTRENNENIALIYCAIALAILLGKEKDIDKNTFNYLYKYIHPESNNEEINAPNYREWRKSVELFIENNGTIPLQMIINIVTNGDKRITTDGY